MSDTLKAGIFSSLSTDAGFMAIAGDRIYPDSAPDTADFPYVTFNTRSENGTHHQTGGGSLVMTTIQFNVWALTPDERDALKDVIRIFFDGKIRQTFGSSFCASVRNTNNTDTLDDPIDEGSQNFVYGVFMDFDFWHER